MLNGQVLAAIGADKSGRTLQWNIINDYRAQLIAEDRA